MVWKFRQDGKLYGQTPENKQAEMLPEHLCFKFRCLYDPLLAGIGRQVIGGGVSLESHLQRNTISYLLVQFRG
ncbi:hypothetical protein [Geitlerinema sp. PCC 9228]|jgi:hypothetical protein|uniref:hypothetical protein n=1 Tax=Geitlerinema sp. PCC 9228 TaxID=111611 RepID=UPI0011148967|nr:hypothetical protein [Geitlerinema sp. PCC 9228]